MRAYFGKDYDVFKQGKTPWEQAPGIYWDTSKLQNGHTLIIGRPGAGKTTLLKRMIAQMQEQGIEARFHVFDVHGDIEIDGASEVMFSESTPYGLHPLQVVEDPHFGGVRKCVASFLRIVTRATGNLGSRQEALLRKLLEDCFKQNGFDKEKPATWRIDPDSSGLWGDGSNNRFYLDVPFAERDDAKQFGAKWDNDERLWYVFTEDYKDGVTRWFPKLRGRMYPTLDDVLTYAKRLLMVAFMGSDQEAITKLEAFQKAVAAQQRKELEHLRKGGVNRPNDLDAPMSELDKARDKAISYFTDYIGSVKTGHEVETMIKYDDVSTLKSVIDRLDTLKATGLFKTKAAPFDPDRPVWRYQLNALSRAEKKLFVMFRLQEIFAAAMQRGHQNKVLDVLVLDEVVLYVDKDDGDDDILTIIAREARKFGVAILAAAQDAQLPQGFIASLATKVVLGIDRSFWPAATTKMGMTADMLKWIQPKACFAVQMQDSSPLSGEWRGVLLRPPVVAPKLTAAPSGQQAA